MQTCQGCEGRGWNYSTINNPHKVCLMCHGTGVLIPSKASYWISYIKIDENGDVLVYDNIIYEHPFVWRKKQNKRNSLADNVDYLVGWKQLTPEEVKLYESG